MKGHQAGQPLDWIQQCRDVAVADERLGVTADKVKVQIGQCAGCAIATAQADDAGHIRIGEHRVQIGGALLIRAGEIAVTPKQMLAGFDAKPEQLDGLDASLDPVILVDGIRRRDHAEGLAWLEASGFDERQ